ncbi:MAG: hypothetical protein QXD62_01585 [Candidatus Woesearchaeota archaeon]
MKKSQSLSINTIIIAALGVVVLIVSIVLFTSQMGKQTTQIDTTTGSTMVESTLSSSGEKSAIIDVISKMTEVNAVSIEGKLSTFQAYNIFDVCFKDTSGFNCKSTGWTNNPKYNPSRDCYKPVGGKEIYFCATK